MSAMKKRVQGRSSKQATQSGSGTGSPEKQEGEQALQKVGGSIVDGTLQGAIKQKTLDQWRLDQKRVSVEAGDSKDVQRGKAKPEKRQKQKKPAETELGTQDAQSQPQNQENGELVENDVDKALEMAVNKTTAADASSLHPNCAVCKQPWDNKSFMVRCDACTKWFHGPCVNLTHAACKILARFTCPECPPSSVPMMLGSDNTTEIDDLDANKENVEKQSITKPHKPNGEVRRAWQKEHNKLSEEQTDVDKDNKKKKTDTGTSKGQSKQGSDVQPVVIPSATGISPGRLILFQWNDSERYEAVVLARASELQKKKSKYFKGKRRQYGPDWWQVQWTSDGTFARSMVLLAESNQDRWQLLPLCAGTKALDVINGEVQMRLSAPEGGEVGGQPLKLNITIGGSAKTGAGGAGLGAGKEEVKKDGAVKGSEGAGDGGKRKPDAAERALERKKARIARENMDMLWTAICLTKN